MNALDFAPLFRSGVGFDRLARMAETAARLGEANAPSYPPYNIEKHGEDAYTITVAVAGFAPEELDVQVEQSLLTVSGHKHQEDSGETEKDSRVILHRGIAERNFQRRFQLADHVVVTGADLENGLLVIRLERRIPEAAKPRRIAIGSSDAAQIEDQAA